MNEFQPELVLFDLDGTLVDSAPDIAAAAEAARDEFGLPRLSVARIKSFIGNGADRLIHRALTDDIDGEADAEMFEIGRRRFIGYYAENICTKSRAYSGVTQTLTRLEHLGCRLGCVTNKPGRFSEPLLKSLGLRQYFTVVVSGDSLPTQKPDPAPLLHAAARCATRPQRCLVVGDSPTDIKAARNAGMAVACVKYGYATLASIEALAPDALLDSMQQIFDHFGFTPTA